MSYQGKEVKDTDKLETHASHVFILSDGVYEEHMHGGSLWSCTKCKTKDGTMMGANRYMTFKRRHTDDKKKNCELFQERLLASKEAGSRALQVCGGLEAGKAVLTAQRVLLRCQRMQRREKQAGK